MRGVFEEAKQSQGEGKRRLVAVGSICNVSNERGECKGNLGDEGTIQQNPTAPGFMLKEAGAFLS